MANNKIWHNVLLVLLYLLIAPPALAAIKDSVHGAFSGVMAWDRPLSNLYFAKGISWVVTD